MSSKVTKLAVSGFPFSRIPSSCHRAREDPIRFIQQFQRLCIDLRPVVFEYEPFWAKKSHVARYVVCLLSPRTQSYDYSCQNLKFMCARLNSALCAAVFSPCPIALALLSFPVSVYRSLCGALWSVANDAPCMPQGYALR